MAGTRALLVGLVAAAAVCGTALAALPTLGVRVHAHLAPAAGTTAAGAFDGLLSRTAGGPLPVQPRVGQHWTLTWKLVLPDLAGSATATIHIGAGRGAAPVMRVLCTGCASSADGTVMLTNSQALRIVMDDATVVVRTRTSMLHGEVKSLARVPGGLPKA